MISPVSGPGIQALYAGMAREPGDVPAVSPVRRRAGGDQVASAGGRPEATPDAVSAAPAAPAHEAGKGLLVDLYA